MEAVIPVEVGSPSFKVAHYNPGLNEEGINLHFDLLQERLEDAHAAWAAYQSRAAKYYDKKVKPRAFAVGDWVLRKVNLMMENWVQSGRGLTGLSAPIRTGPTI